MNRDFFKTRQSTYSMGRRVFDCREDSFLSVGYTFPANLVYFPRSHKITGIVCASFTDPTLLHPNEPSSFPDLCMGATLDCILNAI